MISKKIMAGGFLIALASTTRPLTAAVCTCYTNAPIGFENILGPLKDYLDPRHSFTIPSITQPEECQRQEHSAKTLERTEKGYKVACVLQSGQSSGGGTPPSKGGGIGGGASMGGGSGSGNGGGSGSNPSNNNPNLPGHSGGGSMGGGGVGPGKIGETGITTVGGGSPIVVGRPIGEIPTPESLFPSAGMPRTNQGRRYRD